MPPRACGLRHYVVGLGCLSVRHGVRLSVRPDYIFLFEREGKTGRGWSKLIKKKSVRVGTWGVLTNIYF